MRKVDPNDPPLVIHKNDPVVLAPNAPAILRVELPVPTSRGDVVPVTEDLPARIEYPSVPLVDAKHVGKFALFVAGSYITMTPIWLIYPPQIRGAFEHQGTRTMLCALFIWNLIGAMLFCRTKLHKEDLRIVLAYIAGTPFIPTFGAFMLAMLCANGLSPHRTPEERASFKQQLVILSVFGMPAIFWPIWLPSVVMLIQIALSMQ
jgi:hypothetical protein